MQASQDVPSAEVIDGYRWLPIEKLQESRTNPRRVFHGLEELAESIRKNGVIVSLLVRPSGDAFEVVAGSRRLRAAHLAGQKEVPVQVRRMTDTQVMEFQLIENLQREGLHPMDEARGYQALMRDCEYTQERIGERIGKDQSYIAKRLVLLRLIQPAAEAFLARKLSTEHAVMIGRIQPADQKRALEVIFKRWEGRISRGDLAEWIHREVYVKLRGAPFGLKDAGLLPAAGACEACPKRVGSAPALFSDVKGADTCTDPTCYRQKVDLHIESTAKKLEASGKKFLRLSGDQFHTWEQKKRTPGVLYQGEYRDIEPQSQACEFAMPALVVEGAERGSLLTVCASQRCPRHFPRGAKRAPSQLAAERKAKLATKIKQETERQALQAVLKKIGSQLQLEDLRAVVDRSLDFAGHDVRARLAKFFGVEPVSVEAHGGYKDLHKGFERHIQKLEVPDLNRLLMAVAVSGQKSLLELVARRHGVDLAAIRQRVTAEISGGAK
jgi:ParB/RepB/Spo0J family partition protein